MNIEFDLIFEINFFGHKPIVGHGDNDGSGYGSTGSGYGNMDGSGSGSGTGWGLDKFKQLLKNIK